MEHDEMVAELAELVRGPLVTLADELRSMVATYRQIETEAKAEASAAKSVASMHSASLRAASAKGGADAVQTIVRVLDGATKKGR